MGGLDLGFSWFFFYFMCEIERHKEKLVKKLCQIELPGGVLFLSDSRMLQGEIERGRA